MSASLFIAGDGRLSDSYPVDVSLDLINLRDTFFSEDEYMYNIHNWTRVTVSYVCSAPSISTQVFEILFNIEQGNTSSAHTSCQLKEGFFGSPILKSVTIHDRDNGSVFFLASKVLPLDPSFDLTQGSSRMDRPVGNIIAQDDMTAVYIPLEQTPLFKVGWKMHVRIADYLSPTPLTITAIDHGTGLISFDREPVIMDDETGLVLQAPNGYRYELSITDNGELQTTNNNSAKRSKKFMVEHEKTDESSPPKYSVLGVSSDGVLGFEDVSEDSTLEIINNFYLRSPDGHAWTLKFTKDDKLQMEKKPLTLIGTQLVFARDTYLTEEQLIDYKPN